MPDQTSTVTESDARKMHAWCDSHSPTDTNQTPMAKVIRHFRATVPVPPPTFADELRKAASGLPVEFKLKHQRVYLADRVEAMEEEN